MSTTTRFKRRSAYRYDGARVSIVADLRALARRARDLFRLVMSRALLARERILLALEAWGPGVLYEHASLVRWLRRRDPQAVRHIKEALIGAGLSRPEADALLDGGKAHGAHCACWRCVLRLQAWLLRSAARRMQAEKRYGLLICEMCDGLGYSYDGPIHDRRSKITGICTDCFGSGCHSVELRGDAAAAHLRKGG